MFHLLSSSDDAGGGDLADQFGCVVRDDLIYKWDIDEDDDEEEKKMMLSVTYFFYFFFDEGSLSGSSSESSSGTRTGISGREYHSFCRFSFCLSL